jgi:putative ABC transport system ATP-binding protein
MKAPAWPSSAPPVPARPPCSACWPGWTCPAAAASRWPARTWALDEEARAQLRAREVGFVFQSFHLLPALTAAENVALPLELAGREDRARVDEVLAQVGLAHRARHYPRQLSGGEQQRVALARAFVTRPRILFADEPTGSLDHATGQHISDLLFELNAGSGTTLVLVTHDLRLAQRCQYIHRIDDGRLLPVERGAQA